MQRHGEGSVSVHGAGDVVGEEVVRVLQRLTNNINYYVIKIHKIIDPMKTINSHSKTETI